MLGTGAGAAATRPRCSRLSRQALPPLRRDAGTRTARRRAPMCSPKPTGDAAGHPARDRLGSVARRWRRASSWPRAASPPPSSRCRAGSCSTHSDEAYRRAVLGTAPRLAVEAAIGFGWERYVGDRGRVVGMHGFGASAPAEALFRHFGITPEAVADAADALLAARRGNEPALLTETYRRMR